MRLRSPWLCCTERLSDSLFESSVIAESGDQLGPCKVQAQELVGLQCHFETAWFVIDPLIGSTCLHV